MTVQEIFISSNDHILVRSSYSINSIAIESGDLLWKHIFDEGTSSVAASQGVVYVFSKETRYALDEATGKIIWEEHINNVTQSGKINDISNDYVALNFVSTSFNVYSTHSRNLEWVFPAGRGYHDSCIYKHNLYTFDEHIKSYDLNNGKQMWEDDSIQVSENIACDNGISYFIHDGSIIIAYDLMSRLKLWESNLDTIKTDETGIDINIEGNYLLLYGLEKMYVINKKDGNVISRIEEGMQPTNAQILGDNLYVLYDFDKTIYAYNMSIWNTTGILRISPPAIITFDIDKPIQHTENIFFFWKGKSMFAYK